MGDFRFIQHRERGAATRLGPPPAGWHYGPVFRPPPVYQLLSLQSDGGMLVLSPEGVARLHPNGAPDLQFANHRQQWLEAHHAHYVITAQAEGGDNVLLAGALWNRQGSAPIGLLRLKPAPVFRSSRIQANGQFWWQLGGLPLQEL